MKEFESILYKIMPDTLSHEMKMEGVRMLAESTEAEIKKQAELTGMSADLIRQAAIHVLSMQLPKVVVH